MLLHNQNIFPTLNHTIAASKTKLPAYRSSQNYSALQRSWLVSRQCSNSGIV